MNDNDFLMSRNEDSDEDELAKFLEQAELEVLGVSNKGSIKESEAHDVEDIDELLKNAEMDILSGPQPNHFTRVDLSSDEGAEYLANRMNQKKYQDLLYSYRENDDNNKILEQNDPFIHCFNCSSKATHCLNCATSKATETMDAGVQTGRSYLDNHELGLQQELFELYVDNADIERQLEILRRLNKQEDKNNIHDDDDELVACKSDLAILRQRRKGDEDLKTQALTTPLYLMVFNIILFILFIIVYYVLI